MKAIRGKVTESECLAVVKRMARFYETSLPVPRPIQPRLVPEELINVRRALAEVAKFKRLCEYETVPDELAGVVENMVCTQSYDELCQNLALDDLLPSLFEACKNTVPSGTVHLSIA